MKSTFVFGSLLLITAAAGCASAPPVSERAATASAAIRAASEVGAAGVPRASLHLQLAKEESGKASALAAQGDKDQAASLLLRAEADAELAVALSRESAERVAAEAAMESVRQLKLNNR